MRDFRNLTLKDKLVFDKYFKAGDSALSQSAFSCLFLDKALFKLFWLKAKDCLCLFARQKNSCYLLIPPLGEFDKQLINRCFALMDKYNQDKSISRIENISERQKAKFENLGLRIKKGFCEYVYQRKDLTELRGNRFKAKRANCNYFVKNYDFREEEFGSRHQAGCLELYRHWARQRKLAHADKVYQAMLEENFKVHKLAMENFNTLGFKGLVIKIDSKICAYSLGCKLNKNTFCILFEVVDLTKRGLAQYIFRRMCQNRIEPFINTLDDSGFESLRKTKLSYQPYRRIQAYIAEREF